MNTMQDMLDRPLREVLAIMQQRIVSHTHYFGVQTQKCPNDFWIYQEILTEKRPDVIIEIGNFCGGSTLALAHLCDLIGYGRVIGVDINHNRIADEALAHPRIRFLQGSAPEIVDGVTETIRPNETVMVIEDSSHTFENTLAVLKAYSPLVTVGQYFIVEDGICHHGLDVGPNPGPYEAIEAFMADNPLFSIDRSRESFVITWNPKGYLLRL